MGGLGIHWNFSVHDPPDKVTTRDAHCGHHNEHLKKLSEASDVEDENTNMLSIADKAWRHG